MYLRHRGRLTARICFRQSYKPLCYRWHLFAITIGTCARLTSRGPHKGFLHGLPSLTELESCKYNNLLSGGVVETLHLGPRHLEIP